MTGYPRWTAACLAAVSSAPRPARRTIEGLNRGSLFRPQAVELAIREVSIPVIACKLGTSDRTTRETLRTAKQGQTGFDSATAEDGPSTAETELASRCDGSVTNLSL